jgi:hypothetical protein
MLFGRAIAFQLRVISHRRDDNAFTFSADICLDALHPGKRYSIRRKL